MEELIYLVRHGQTEFNHAKRLQGQCDSALTELGMQQARRMGDCLKALIDDPDQWEMIASPLGRTVHTAEIIRETIGLKSEIRLDQRIQELHVGDWEGFHHHEIEAASPGMMQEPGWLLRAPGGERYEDLAGRVGAFLAEIDETDGRRRIIVSHGITGRIMRALYSGLPPDQIWGGTPPPQDSVFHFSGGNIVRIDDNAVS